MKIAVASLGKTIDSDVSDRAGRAPYYLIFDGQELSEAVKNPFGMGGGGAGYGVAKMLADKGVEKIFAGKFGEKMPGMLAERGLNYEEATGKVSGVVSKISEL